MATKEDIDKTIAEIKSWSGMLYSANTKIKNPGGAVDAQTMAINALNKQKDLIDTIDKFKRNKWKYDKVPWSADDVLKLITEMLIR